MMLITSSNPAETQALSVLVLKFKTSAFRGTPRGGAGTRPLYGL
jgi:hypothetical protein